ncbi:MAG: hypothetical protein IKC37_00780 [Clostridia bacterium]|nr:hypothetical protein [Clostridia bacterium]
MDDLYKEALKITVEEQKVSFAQLQRKLSIGFCKAGELLEKMVEDGYISEVGMKGKVLINQAQLDEILSKN